MTKSSLLVCGLLVLVCRIAGGEVVPLNGHNFTLPDGFTIEMVAGPPLVDRPITADFDEEGRLYVADSSGSNDKVEKQLAEKPHRIVRLEDTDGDGRFDRSVVFADKMMFPEGTMWLDGSLYVSAPPSIWKLTDTDGDGVADQRKEWFQGKTLTGCANDLHGPYLGPDGWIYWCKGAFAQQTYERPGKPPLVTRASHIFRCRPDGTGIEPVMTGGMDNPVDVVFTPGGERILSNTFLVHPGGGQRDGLIHAVYGGVYGKVHEVLDGHPSTGRDVMPVMTHMGPAAPCGLVRYESHVFGDVYRDNLFAAQFNLQKVSRHVLEPSGATFSSRDEDFVVSDNKDFHPTDVLEDADGSLLIVDTGGWYKLCCPTSQLVKVDVLGAIYRVRRKNAAVVHDPRGRSVQWTELQPAGLAELLDDERPAVRARAVRELAARGEIALRALASVLQTSASSRARVNSVWALSRIDGQQSRKLVRNALSDSDETVRQVAIHTASVTRDALAAQQLIGLLQDPSLQIRRAAAEALGRLDERSAVPELLEAAGKATDRTLQHSLTYALIEIAEPQLTILGIASEEPLTQRAALVALDQMNGVMLDAAMVVPLLQSKDTALKDAASWVVGRHPEWADTLAGYFKRRIEDSPRDVQRVELIQHLAAMTSSASVQELLAGIVVAESGSSVQRLAALNVMAKANLKVAPPVWDSALAQTLRSADKQAASRAISVARSLTFRSGEARELAGELSKISADSGAPIRLRLEALSAMPDARPELTPPVFSLLLEQLDSNNPAELRALATEVLTKADLNPIQLQELARKLQAVGPLELDRLLSAFERSDDDEIGKAVVGSLRNASALSSLRVENLKARISKFGPAVQSKAEKLYAELDSGTAKHGERLEAMLTSLADGDTRRGQLVFNGTKASCSACHAIGYLGGKVGPDLTRIGQIRTRRDLLEAIVFPSASFVRSYEPVLVATNSGKVHSGLVRKDAPDEVVLATGANEQVQIARDEIDEIRPSTVSIMPAGLDQQLTQQEIADLIAFLEACK